jgi:L-rhamnose mutarotase
MKRTCFALDLKDDEKLIEAYENIHKPENIWPEIPAGIREGGIIDMQIYRIGNHLFMIAETEEGVDLNVAFDAIAKMPKQDVWAAFMATFQQKIKEAQPNEHWAKMKQVFALTDCVK